MPPSLLVRALQRLWLGDDDLVVDPPLSVLVSTLEDMPPDGRLVITRPVEPTRAEYYLQIARSGRDARYWHVEIRLGSAEKHFVTRTSDLSAAIDLLTDWTDNEDALPDNGHWFPWRRGSSYEAQRTYDLVALIAGPDADALWKRDLWMTLVPTLTPLLDTGRGRVGVLSMQTEPAGPAARREWVKFGAMSWTPRSHERWTHDETDTRTFHQAEIWAPGRPTCYRQGTPPDVFMRITGDPHGPVGSSRHNVLVALATDIEHQAAGEVLRRLRDLMHPAVIATKTRPWGFSMAEHVYSQPIGDVDLIKSITATQVSDLAEETEDRTTMNLPRWQALAFE